MAKKILLVCAGGFSTSMLVEKMKEEAASKGLEIIIDACAENAIESNLPADVIMLGPQMGHAEDGVKVKVGPQVPVTTIDMMDYGMMDGEKVLDAAKKLMGI
ncbi:MAG TPA: PTS sugar transporter subunit IIB [Eubacteriaceae bacterium]|jgi:PTS system cellobiose-specific IIB component|nr:PTS sugar transporter subunit IIB [Eubacteriaceae bacterium]